jgi:transposase
MIPIGVEVFVGLAAIDLRWGFDRLAGVVQQDIGRMPRGGALFVFFGKRRTAMKVLFFDGTGLCVFYKRLDRGTFCIPQALHADAVSIELSERELHDLLDGIDVESSARTRAPRRGGRRTRALAH